MDPKSFHVMDVPSIDTTMSSAEMGINSVLTAKPRKKTMTSVYLKYFETVPDGKSRRCKFCGQIYSIATATGNLGRHLSNRHPGYEKTKDSNNSIIATQPVTLPKKPPPQVRLPQPELDNLNWLLIKWLIKSSLPLSTLSENSLVNSFKFLNPSSELWPYEKFQTVLNEVHRSMQETVRSTVEQISASKVSLTLEFWTSFEQIMYMSISCQWIDENWSFQKILLDISLVPSPCGGPQIYQTLLKVLNFYNLGNKIISCTHDNSPNAIHACHNLKNDIDGRKVGPFCYVPCAALTLNSITSDALESTKPIVSKIREFVLELNSSKSISDDFSQFATVYHEGNWVFPVDASHRWSGSYQMFDIARKAGKSMEAVASKYDEQLAYGGVSLLLNSAERNIVNLMHRYLEPFYKTINDMGTNKFPTTGLVLFFMDHISEIILACKDSRQTPEWLKTASEEMHTKAQNYTKQVCNASMYMSAVLDPRIKIELIPEYLNSESYLEVMRNHFITNYSTGYFSSSMISSSYISQDSDGGGSFSFAEEIARKRRRASLNCSTDELTQYFSEPPVPMTTDVFEWWRGNSSRYPRLSCMARDMLVVQSTAVNPEEVFCKKGDEVERTRFSMSRCDSRALICIKSWMGNGILLNVMEVGDVGYGAESRSRSYDKKQKI